MACIVLSIVFSADLARFGHILRRACETKKHCVQSIQCEFLVEPSPSKMWLGVKRSQVRILSENGKLLVTVGWNENIRIWNVETGTEVQSLQGSEGDVWSAAFCGDSTHLVSGGQDGTARVWQLSDGAITATLRGHDAAVHNISLDPMGYGVATSSRDGTIRVWDLSSLKE